MDGLIGRLIHKAKTCLLTTTSTASRKNDPSYPIDRICLPLTEATLRIRALSHKARHAISSMSLSILKFLYSELIVGSHQCQPRKGAAPQCHWIECFNPHISPTKRILPHATWSPQPRRNMRHPPLHARPMLTTFCLCGRCAVAAHLLLLHHARWIMRIVRAASNVSVVSSATLHVCSCTPALGITHRPYWLIPSVATRRFLVPGLEHSLGEYCFACEVWRDE